MYHKHEIEWNQATKQRKAKQDFLTNFKNLDKHIHIQKRLRYRWYHSHIPHQSLGFWPTVIIGCRHASPSFYMTRKGPERTCWEGVIQSRESVHHRWLSEWVAWALFAATFLQDFSVVFVSVLTPRLEKKKCIVHYFIQTYGKLI